MRVAIVTSFSNIADELYGSLSKLIRNLFLIKEGTSFIILINSRHPLPRSLDMMISLDELEALRFSFMVKQSGIVLMFKRREKEEEVITHDAYPNEDLIKNILSESHQVSIINLFEDDACIAYTLGIIASLISKNLNQVKYLVKDELLNILIKGFEYGRRLMSEIK